MSGRYKINEIFYSLQGEGFWVGRPAVFIRFSGCNLRCPFCDTNHWEGVFMSVDDIIFAVKEYPTDFVVLTGGEPALQIDSVLLRRLRQLGYYIAIETNGTIPLKRGIDWITVSPKILHSDKKWVVRKGDELKVVYEGQDLDIYLDSDFEYYFLQPCCMKNIKETVEKVLEKGSKWRLSLQIHKMLKIK